MLTIYIVLNGGLQARIECVVERGLGTAESESSIKVGHSDTVKERESMLEAVSFQAPPRRAQRKLDANAGVVQTSIQEVLSLSLSLLINSLQDDMIW